jgi:hypothetical protein
MIFDENLLKEIIKESSAVSRSQKGDVSKHLLEQGFFDEGVIPEGLKKRDKFPSGGNPIDTIKNFERQQQI